MPAGRVLLKPVCGCAAEWPGDVHAPLRSANCASRVMASHSSRMTSLNLLLQDTTGTAQARQQQDRSVCHSPVRG